MYSIFRYATRTLKWVVCAVVIFVSGCQEQGNSKAVTHTPLKTLESAQVDPAAEQLIPALEKAESAPLAAAQPALEVHIRGAKSTDGVYFCALFDSEEGFGKRTAPVRSDKLPVSTDAVTWSIEMLPPGEYAIAVYHDANENEILDRHALGFPIESYGFSNNARGKLGPPSYDQVRFRVEEGTPCELQLLVK